MEITTIGIDLAKNVFQVHGVDQRGKVILRKQLRREQMVEFFAKVPPCLVGMEACGSAHHWARVTLAVFSANGRCTSELDVRRPHGATSSKCQRSIAPSTQRPGDDGG